MKLKKLIIILVFVLITGIILVLGSRMIAAYDVRLALRNSTQPEYDEFAFMTAQANITYLVLGSILTSLGGSGLIKVGISQLEISKKR